MRSYFSLLLIAIVFLGSVGCANMNRTPRYITSTPMEVKTFKRYARWANVDYFRRFSWRAYENVEKPIIHRLSADQENILERHGQPDWLRKGFRATTGEYVDEWIWYDRAVTAQFVERELVFEGPMTDMDRYRIQYGYPRRAFAQDYERGVRRDVWDYQAQFFSNEGKIVTFSDEKLVSESNY